MSKGIVFFDNPEDMPIKRFQRFNKYVLIDAEVGETFEDYEQRTFKAISFLRKGLVDDAVKELNNRRQMVYNAYEQYSPKQYALALLVKSIDGVDYSDKKYITEEGLNEILEILNSKGYSKKEMDIDLPEVKKKSLKFWKCISPNNLETAMNKISIFFSEIA